MKTVGVDAEPGRRQRGIDAIGGETSWAMLDYAPDGMLVVSESGEIVFANAQAATLFATNRESLVGSHVDLLMPEQYRGAHRAHRNRYRARPSVRAMGAGRLLSARRTDGTEFHAEISLSPFFAGEATFVVAAVRDISERVAAEDHLRRVLHTLDVSDDAIWMFDAATLDFTHVNDGAVRMVGYSAEELIAMTPLHLETRSTTDDYAALVTDLVSHPERAVRREAVLLRRDGAEVPVELTYRAAPVGYDGAQWIVAMARDITQRLEAEEELRANQTALDEAERIMMLVDERERIARDLHDTVIQRLFAAGLSLQSVLRVADETARPRIERTIDDLDATIRELRSTIFSLGASTPTMGGLRGRIMDAISEVAETGGFESRVRFDGPVETLDPVIAEHLVPVVREAVTNAVRHSGGSTVRVSVSVGDDVVVSVVDDGRGVEGEVIGGRGTTNLAERAAELGGTSELRAGDAGGTELRWVVPVADSGKLSG